MAGAGSIAGAAITVGLLGVTLGVAGRTISNTNKQLKVSQRRGRRKNVRLQKAGIF